MSEGGAQTALDEFYADVSDAGLQPLWTQEATLMPFEPRPATVEWLWRWKTLRGLAERAGALVPVERGGDRRVLSLSNPGLAGAPFATSTLWGAVQYLGPHESAPAHRHTPGAIRFVLEGEGVWTTVNGDACDMHPGDLVLTPSWNWHDHRNDGDVAMIWFDGLDLPTVIALDAVFYEDYPGLLQDVTGSHNRSERVWGGRATKPLEREAEGGHSPLLVYRWSEIDESLTRLLDEQGGPMVALEYVDPSSGGSVLPTLGCEMYRIQQGCRTASHQKVGSSVYVVWRGAGSSVINGHRLDWEQGDMFVSPSWSTVDHEATEPSDLFAITDRPVLQSLGLFRSRVLGDPQPITDESAPT